MTGQRHSAARRPEQNVVVDVFRVTQLAQFHIYMIKGQKHVST